MNYQHPGNNLVTIAETTRKPARNGSSYRRGGKPKKQEAR